jgi:RNA polymerase sigma factor (sigma-70 family)
LQELDHDDPEVTAARDAPGHRSRMRDVGARDALDAYLRVAGDHRLLAAHEERELARAMAAARVQRAAALFAWQRVPLQLLARDPATVLEAGDASRARFMALRADLGVLAHAGARREDAVAIAAGDLAELASLPWRETALQPYATEWLSHFRRTQACERALRQLCLFAAGMPRRYYAERLPADLLDVRWLRNAARARVISAEAHAVLRLELAPVLSTLQPMVRSTGMDIGALRTGYRRFHEASHAHRALRDELALHNLRLVIAMARKYERPGMPLADLVQEGNIGLLRAIDKFDPELGYRFSTYATWWVRQALQRAQLEQGRVVRVPAHVQDEARLLHRTTEAFVHAHGREPRNDELARLSGLPMARLDTLRALFAEALSLDAPRHEDGDGDWHASIAGASEGGDVAHERDELVGELDALLRSLPDEQSQLLRLRFGVGARGEHSPEAVRSMLDLSPARIRELERQALATLRTRAEGLRIFLE